MGPHANANEGRNNRIDKARINIIIIAPLNLIGAKFTKLIKHINN